MTVLLLPSSDAARTTLLSEMRKAVQASASLAATLSEAKEAHLSLAGAVEQRLKWAGGANPALADTRNTFAQLLDQWTDAVQVRDCAFEGRCRVEGSQFFRKVTSLVSGVATRWLLWHICC